MGIQAAGPFPIFHLVLSLLSVLLYVSALVLWPLYQFSEELGGQPQRPSNGDWDKLTSQHVRLGPAPGCGHPDSHQPAGLCGRPGVLGS